MLKSTAEKLARARYIPYWEKCDHHWVVCLDHGGFFSFHRAERFDYEKIAKAPMGVVAAHVFKSDGLHIRAYRRVYSYFRRDDDFSILEFSERERAQIFKGLGRGMRQWENG